MISPIWFVFWWTACRQLSNPRLLYIKIKRYWVRAFRIYTCKLLSSAIFVIIKTIFSWRIHYLIHIQSAVIRHIVHCLEAIIILLTWNGVLIRVHEIIHCVLRLNLRQVSHLSELLVVWIKLWIWRKRAVVHRHVAI